MVVEESDEEIIEACRYGDPDAFRALFEKHKNRVYSIALRYSGDRMKGQPVILARKCSLVGIVFGNVDVLRGELSSQVQAVVASLPDKQRILIVLRYTEGLTYEEIADVAGISSGTVASQLNRIHKTLERRLSKIARREGLPG